MPTPQNDALTYYKDHGFISAPGRFSHLFKDLPADISQLCRIIQGLLVHAFWAERDRQRDLQNEVGGKNSGHLGRGKAHPKKV